MKAVIQRTRSAGVLVSGAPIARIDAGMLILLGVAHTDTTEVALRLARKIARLRIFDDENGVMNRSLLDNPELQVLVVSQFTLMASTARGNRPSYVAAAPATVSEPLYRAFVDGLSAELSRPVATGRFGADMQVALINDGPVTIIIDTDNP